MVAGTYQCFHRTSVVLDDCSREFVLAIRPRPVDHSRYTKFGKIVAPTIQNSQVTRRDEENTRKRRHASSAKTGAEDEKNVSRRGSESGNHSVVTIRPNPGHPRYILWYQEDVRAPGSAARTQRAQHLAGFDGA